MLTFVIACAPYHEAIVREAVASVAGQTVRCEAVVIYDAERRGAGWARNEGLRQVKTPFVSFLDADDLLDPVFAEETLRAYDGRRYVFTDWITDRVIEAPHRPWAGDGTSHIVTTLIPTIWARAIGGFDEALPGGEDTDFYWKLTRSGYCGKRLAKPLVCYRKGGQRAEAFIHSAEYQTIMRGVVARYEGKPMACGDCGEIPDDVRNAPSNAPLPGDVLAETLWAGNRQERGRASGRLYPRTGNSRRLWIDPRDIDAAPHLFSRVIETPPPVTDADLEFMRFARHAIGGNTPSVQAPEPAPAIYAEPGIVQPNVGKVLRLYQQAN